MKRLAAIGLSAVMALAGCTTGTHQNDDEGSGSPASSGTTTSVPAPTYAPALARFYTQKIDWTDCPTTDDAKCATLTVPVDYARPTGETITLALLKRPSPSKKKKGALIVNPGGPGGSGVDYAMHADAVFSPDVNRAYDVVGFDPRGVGGSAPVVCYDGPQFDAFLALDPTPDDAAEEKALLDGDRAFGQACQKRNPALLAHMSTEDVARDMDVLRGALGESQLNYFGASYGTFLGATYADLFPKNVGRMVLDGAIDPRLDSQQLVAGQAGGFERAFDAFVSACVSQGGCPLGDDDQGARQRVRDLMKRLDASPLPARTGPSTGLNEAWASYGIAAALYDQGSWKTLKNALRGALDGDGTPLMTLAAAYVERGPDGSYDGNMLQVINAVNCLDRAASSDPTYYRSLQGQYTAKWPTFGPFMAWSGMICGTWPVPATGKAHAITAPGSKPIVVVGTTRDPATPYEEAVALAEQLQNGILISRDGDGHTGYQKGNGCVDKAVDGYLIRDVVPARKTTC